jgi:ankyrin repeat protein
MTAAKALPPRPSLDSLRKQARTLARDAAAGDAAAAARVRAVLPAAPLPLTLRSAQLVIAREYGYPGWPDLTAAVRTRLGTALSGAAAQARRAIHDDDVERLRQLLAEYPALASWRDEGGGADGSLLGFAAESYGDSFETAAEAQFTRAGCAEVLIEAGAVPAPAVLEGLLASRARGLLRLFGERGLLPRTLRFHAALADVEAVHAALAGDGLDPAAVTAAFATACRFGHEAIARLLLERAVADDPDLGSRVDGSIGRQAFITAFIDTRPGHIAELGLWRAFVVEQVNRAVYSWSGAETSLAQRRGRSDLPAFTALLRREPWLLDDPFVAYQTAIVERAALVGRAEFVTALLDLDPAILRRPAPPPSQALEFAFTYANTQVVPALTRIWPLPDDLPHAAGLGDAARVARWFDAAGTPALGDLRHHYPFSAYLPKDRVEEYTRQWGPPSAQRVLDAALAWAVINGHLDVADLLLRHGADVNTTWSSHEPASLLHELVWHRNREAMQFLIDRGIDMTIKDYRWKATAQGWAAYAAEDAELARWLGDAERRQART